MLVDKANNITTVQHTYKQTTAPRGARRRGAAAIHDRPDPQRRATTTWGHRHR